MNIAGPLATIIFAITVLTVFGGLFAYGIYKARERTRGRQGKAPSDGLEWFEEFVLPGSLPIREAVDVAPAPFLRGSLFTGARGPFMALGAIAAVFVVLIVSYFGVGRRIISQGAWTTPVEGDDAAVGAGQGGRVVIRQVPRAAPPDLSKARPRRASLFVTPNHDVNGDGQIQPDERSRIHEQTPQFITVSCDDNGSTQGLEFVKETFERDRVWGKAVFFMTGNYLEGKPNYLGGTVDAWWQVLFFENFAGLHGTTHASGSDDWDLKRWESEHGETLKEILKRNKLPDGWTWGSYPWGSRAPFLMATDEYFTALEKVEAKVHFDSSLVVHPITPPPAELPDVRDVPWPFTLDTPLPAEVELPYLEKEKRRIELRPHRVWEVPVTSWLLRPRGGAPRWEPSLDYNLWKYYPCKGDEPNMEAVDVVVDNLRAHYRGNRAPFNIGLHAQNYTKDRACERRTMAAVFDRVARLADEGYNFRYLSMPELVTWVDRKSHE